MNKNAIYLSLNNVSLHLTNRISLQVNDFCICERFTSCNNPFGYSFKRRIDGREEKSDKFDLLALNFEQKFRNLKNNNVL